MTLDEQKQKLYGDTFEEIEDTPPEQVEEKLRRGKDGFSTGVVRKRKPDGDEIESPFTVKTAGPRNRSVKKIHENRSERAQDVDEQQNAPVTTDEELWIENKNEYDYPGVDTIPARRRAARAEAAARIAQEQGAVDRVEQKGSAKNLQGKFSPEGQSTYGVDDTVVRVQNTASDPGRTLAHEIGHSLDYAYGDRRGYGLSDELFDLDTPVSEGETEALVDEAKELSEKARGGFGSQGQYRRQFTELTADVVGQAIIQPRATKRDAPKLFERVQELGSEVGIDDATPEPLGREPEREGFLQNLNRE
jgi:hypothetical protein